MYKIVCSSKNDLLYKYNLIIELKIKIDYNLYLQ